MLDFVPELERREHLRHRRGGVACDVFLAGKTHGATVLDFSRGGVFVQSEAPAWPGALVRVRLHEIDRHALVVRERHIPHRLRSLLPRGFALRWVATGTIAR